MSLGNTLVAAAVSRSPAERPLRVETIYDEERASMKIIIVGGVADTAEVFRLVTTLVKEPA